MSEYNEWIGRQVHKRSKKPFKSGATEATVTGITINKHTGKEAFTFDEDDSVVDAWICRLT